MFNTKEAKVDGGFKTPQFIKLGPNELKIVSLEAKKSRAGDKFVVQANFETKPLGGDFEGWEGALGQIGRCPLSIYTNGSDNAATEFIGRIATIADAMGVRDQIDSIQSSTIEDYLDKVSKIMNNKYAWFLVGAEEYEGKDKEGNPKIKETMMLPRFGYVAPTEAELQAKMKDGIWPDKTVSWFFKPLVGMDAETINKEVGATGKPTDDLPF